jgi:SAM-dependent MidA family methyltransferase
MTPLEAEIRARIEEQGPISVADYMEMCLSHPTHGYYATRDPFGVRGDFVTAPEISQMFGELIGLWAASVWQIMGEPDPLQLVELGPGRGTMMADVLRAARIVPGFAKAVRVHLVETSPVLRARQKETLSGFGVPLTWHDGVRMPWKPSIVLANEFLDALPVNQAVKVAGGWRERKVAIDGDRLAFTLDGDVMWRVDEALPAGLRGAPEGAVFEWRVDWIMREIARHAASYGTALLIDYGHSESGIGETLQAVAGHRFADPLAAPGEADLTAHVDFQALREAAASQGPRIHGPVTQGEFLRRLGIAERAAKLKATASPAQAADIDAALARLTDSGPTGMGSLFKVMAMAHPQLPPLPGFDPARATQ